MPLAEISEWAECLRRNQNPEGGFPYFPGRKSSFEPTALAILALHYSADGADTEGIRRGQNHLLGRQEPSGLWPVSAEDSSPAWEIPFVLLALSGNSIFESSCRAGINAYLKILAEPANPQGTTLNPRWRGWNWYPPTPGWVEPTSLGLIAARRLGHLADSSMLADRLEDGRQFLLDRMAPDGGWNYGNSYVLGRALSSFHTPTAMALLALQPSDGEADRLQRSVLHLETDLATTTSGLALSWGILALTAYRRPTRQLSQNLLSAWRRSRFLENIAVVSLAVLAATSSRENHPFLTKG
jgi:hypothetical protein